MNSRWLLAIAIALALAAMVALVVVLMPQGSGPASTPRYLQSVTNAQLDIRISFAPEVFTPVAGQERAEFPLQLKADDFVFYGKRIRGGGSSGAWVNDLKQKKSKQYLYDLVGSLQYEVLESYFGLVPVGEPVYTDTMINGKLVLHQQLIYRLGARSSGWPRYFPESVTGPKTLESDGEHYSIQSLLTVPVSSATAEKTYIEGWVMFTYDDLYYFQAISDQPLENTNRDQCINLLASMEFGVTGIDNQAITAPPR